MTEGRVSPDIFERVTSVIAKYLFYVAVGAVAVSGVMTGIDVIMRYFLSRPIPGIYQLQEIFLVAMIALPLAYDQEKKLHIRVDILFSLFKGKARPAFELITVMIAFVLFGLATWTTGQAAWKSFVTGDYYLGAVHYPYWPSKTMIPLGTSLLCLRLLIEAVRYGRDLFRTAPAAGAR